MTREQFCSLNKSEMETNHEIVSIRKQDGQILNLRVFDHPNMTSFKCPICHLSVDDPIVLVPKPGTERGKISEAVQVHKGCFDMFGLMYMEGV